MDDKEKTKEQLLDELERLRQQVAELQKPENERKQVEEALRASEERFALAVQGSNDGIWDWDIANNTLYWSPRLKELLGYADSELDVSFDTFESHLHPDDKAPTNAAIEAHLKNRVLYDVEERLRTRSGEYRWFLARGQAIWDEAGNPLRMVGFTTDITERKQAEAKLERRTVQLQVAAEVSRITTSILDPEELMRQVVNLVRERFDLYYVGLFLLDEARRFAVLRAGTGEAGHKMLEAGHKLEVGGKSMVGQCVAEAKARIALDVGREAVRFDNPLLPQTRSEMALPLVSRGQVIGAMTIQSDQAAAFSEEDIIVLQTMADQLANGIGNVRLFEKIQRQVQELAFLNEASRTMTSSLDLEQVLMAVMQKATDVLRVEAASILLLDDEGKELVLRTVVGPQAEELKGLRLSLDRGVAGWVAREGQPLLVPDVREDPRFYAGIDGVTGFVTRSILTVPLKVKGKVIGVIEAVNKTEGEFSQADLELLSSMTQSAAIAIENARLFEQGQQVSLMMSLRVRELACLNDIGRKMEETPPVPKFLQWVAQRISSAMQHPEVCMAAIEFEGESYGPAEAMSLPRQIVHALRIGGKVVGRVYIAYTEEYDFLDEESALLGDIVRRVSGYIESRRLFEETQARAEELAVLNEMSRALTRMLDVDAVIESFYRYASRLIDTTNFYVALYHPEQNEVSFPFYAEGELRRRPERRRTGGGLTEYVIRTREPLLIEENVVTRLKELGIELIGQEAQSWLGVPMAIGDQVIGVIAAQSYTTPRLYNEHHRALLIAIANQAAIAIENARLFEQIQTRAERERAIREISDQMQQAADMETLMRIAAEELNRVLGGSRAYVRLGTEAELIDRDGLGRKS